MNKSIQLARLFCALDEVQRKISGEIVPAIIHQFKLAPSHPRGDEAELAQTLELAAMNARNYLDTHPLTVERRMEKTLRMEGAQPR